jgi:hypothetical protein
LGLVGKNIRAIPDVPARAADARTRCGRRGGGRQPESTLAAVATLITAVTFHTNDSPRSPWRYRTREPTSTQTAPASGVSYLNNAGIRVFGLKVCNTRMSQHAAV